MNLVTKKLLIGTAVIAGAFGVYKLSKKPKESTSETTPPTPTPTPTPTPVPNNPPIISADLDFSKLSSELEGAFGGFGTDNTKVREVFSKMNTDADVQKLISTYGERKIPSGVWLMSDYKGGLFDTIKDEDSGFVLAWGLDNNQEAINKIFEQKKIQVRI